MSIENDETARPSTAGSDSTKKTQAHPGVGVGEEHSREQTDVSQVLKAEYPTGGEGESALPEDKKEEVIENAEDDWVHDPRNPRNWSSGKKWLMVSIVSLYTFVSPLASSMMAPGLPEIAEHFKITNETVIALTLSVFLLTYAVGPLFLGPLSEMYGRTWVYHISNLFFLAFNIACGYSPNTGVLIGMRVLAGFFGSAPIALGGGTISDLYSEKDRASAMAVYTLGPLVGPAVGPIAGGFIVQTVGFKWIFVVIAVLCAIAAVFGIPFLRETYSPVIRLRLAKASADPEKTAQMHPHLVQNHGEKLRLLWINLSRPFMLLFGSAICFLLSLYMAFMYGIYYLMFTTFPALFQRAYGFSPGIAGLCYIGLGLGFFAASLFGASFADKIYKHLSGKNGGKGKPEFRIPALIVGSLIVPVGLFWYGWSAQAKTHWIMPIIGSGIYGFGMMTTFLPIQLYLVDTFTYAASATAAASVLRSLLGFAFPLFGQQMFNALGNGGGNSLLAGLSIVLGIPFPLWLYFYGERVRARSSLAR